VLLARAAGGEACHGGHLLREDVGTSPCDAIRATAAILADAELDETQGLQAREHSARIGLGDDDPSGRLDGAENARLMMRAVEKGAQDE